MLAPVRPSVRHHLDSSGFIFTTVPFSLSSNLLSVLFPFSPLPAGLLRSRFLGRRKPGVLGGMGRLYIRSILLSLLLALPLPFVAAEPSMHLFGWLALLINQVVKETVIHRFI